MFHVNNIRLTKPQKDTEKKNRLKFFDEHRSRLAQIGENQGWTVKVLTEIFTLLTLRCPTTNRVSITCLNMS